MRVHRHTTHCGHVSAARPTQHYLAINRGLLCVCPLGHVHLSPFGDRWTWLVCLLGSCVCVSLLVCLLPHHSTFCFLFPIGIAYDTQHSSPSCVSGSIITECAVKWEHNRFTWAHTVARVSVRLARGCTVRFLGPCHNRVNFCSRASLQLCVCVPYKPFPLSTQLFYAVVCLLFMFLPVTGCIVALLSHYSTIFRLQLQHTID